MRKAMTRKFIAAVLAFAMLFTTVAFAAPIILPDGRNPATPVTLTVHHTQGALSVPVPGPGPWIPPAPPTAARPPVVGSIWRLARVEGPALFTPEVLNPPPASIDGVSSLPAAVRNAITAGQLGAPDAQGRRPVTGQTGWYVTSGGTNATAMVNAVDGAHTVPAVPGAFQLATNNDGIAPFTGLNAGLTAPDIGHGLWLLWEVYIHESCEDYESPTEYFDVILPFLVNLPTYVHVDWDGVGTPPPGHPGDWLYNVHVFPKGVRDTEFLKTFEGAPVIGSDHDENSATFGEEYAILDWNINIGFDNVINQLLTPSLPNFPNGFVVDLSVAPTPTPPPLAAGLHRYILVTDTLDSRMRLLENDYVPTSGPAAGVPTPVAGEPHADADWWLTVTVTARDSDLNPTGATTNLPRVSGGNVNWVVQFAPAALPGPPVTYPRPQTFWVSFTQYGIEAIHAAGHAEYGGEIDIFFRTIAEDITTLAELVRIENDATLNFGNRPGWNIRDRQPNNVPGTYLHALVVDKINPSGAQLNGAVFFLFTQDQGTITEGAAGEAATFVPNAGVLPYRVAISGGWAGNNANIVFPNNPALTQAQEDLILAQAAIPWAQQGEAVFLALPPTNWVGPAHNPAANADGPIRRYFLYEAVAPLGNDGSQYRRITTIREVQVGGSGTCILFDDAAHDCANPLHVCTFRSSVDFTNTRDFYLPMTGGAGTIIFTTAGISLMGIAGLFLFLARKKDTKRVRTQ